MNQHDDEAGMQMALRSAMYGTPTDRSNEVAYAVIGAGIEVHRILGPGYPEPVYQLAMEEELRLRGMPFRAQVPRDIEYKGVKVGSFRFDLIVDECLLVELKHVEAIGMIHVSQVIGYLKCTGLDLGLILNFRTPALKDGVRRVVSPY